MPAKSFFAVPNDLLVCLIAIDYAWFNRAMAGKKKKKGKSPSAHQPSTRAASADRLISFSATNVGRNAE